MFGLRKPLTAALAVACIAAWGIASVQAQPGGRGPGGRGFGGRGGPMAMAFGGNLADLLRREDVQKELELLDDQVKALEELGASRRDRMRELFSQLRDVPESERRERARELFQKAAEEVEKEIDQILLPHQSKRLKQLAFQFRLRGGVTRALASEQVAEELGITEEQRERLRAKAEQLEEEVRRKLAELRRQAQEELLKELTPPQQAKWKEMVGEPFEFQRIEPPRFGGDRGRPFGRPRPRGGR